MDKVNPNTSTPQGLTPGAGQCEQVAQEIPFEQEIPFDQLPLEEKINRLYIGTREQNVSLRNLERIVHNMACALDRHTHDAKGQTIMVQSVHPTIYNG